MSKTITMQTVRYNGMYIQVRADKAECYVSDDTNYFAGRMFKSMHAAKIAITKARNAGALASR